MQKLFNLIIGGTIGTLARYFLSGFTYQVFGSNFPYGTLVVNLIGCFIVGFLASIAEEKNLLDTNTRILLMAGFCGAFTTFSTFILETSNLIKDGETIKASLNVIFSVIIGFIVFRLGVLIAKIIY